MEEGVANTNELIRISKAYERVPKWDFDGLSERNCPFCNSVGEAKYIRYDKLPIYFCDICGTFFVSPAPTLESLNQFYRNYFSKHFTSYTLQNSARFISSLDPSDDFRVTKLASIAEPKGAMALDVGCGNGATLVRLKKLGANVEGVDLDLNAVTFVRDELGICNVKNCNFEDFDAEGKYDIITMIDFIEHPLSPLLMIKKAKRLLAEKGVLAIYTPNASFVHCQREPTIFMVALEHLQYLTFKSFKYISNLLNFDIVHLESCEYLCPDNAYNDAGKQNDFLQSVKYFVWAVMRKAPGFSFLNTPRRLIKDGRVRVGGDFLFCILQNDG